MPIRTATTQTLDDADSALVALGKDGDRAAIDELIHRYERHAYLVAMRLLRCPEDAEEAAQDALWAAVRHLGSFREDACFRTWFHRIVINQSLMLLRRRQSSPLASATTLAEEGSPHSGEQPSTPERILLDTECRTVIDHGLSRVPGFYSVALRLYALEGWAIRDIAIRLGISEGAVKTRLHRARLYLRRAIPVVYAPAHGGRNSGGAGSYQQDEKTGTRSCKLPRRRVLRHVGESAAA